MLVERLIKAEEIGLVLIAARRLDGHVLQRQLFLARAPTVSSNEYYCLLLP